MTTETKHTPGPWSIKRSPGLHDGQHDYAINAEGATVLAEAYGRSSLGGILPAEANASLISAAPDMLAALKGLEAIVSEIHAKWDEGMKSGKLLIALMDPSLRYRADCTAIHAAIAKAEGRQ